MKVPLKYKYINCRAHKTISLAWKNMFKEATFRDGRSISQNVASVNILGHDLISLLYYEHWTEKWKYFYVYQNALWWNHSSEDTETMIKYSCYTNHLQSSIRCHRNKILPKDLKLSRITTERSNTILQSSPDDGRSISRNVASSNILVYDLMNLLHDVCRMFVNSLQKSRETLLHPKFSVSANDWSCYFQTCFVVKPFFGINFC